MAPKCSSVVEEDKSYFMIRFLKKRTTLTKELLKKKRGGDVKELEAFFKKLKDNQLEMLHLAVQTEGENLSGCVLLPKDKDPHVLCCQAWRWPTIQNVDIRRLPVCKSASDVIYICCNPYHWSRLYIPGKCNNHYDDKNITTLIYVEKLTLEKKTNAIILLTKYRFNFEFVCVALAVSNKQFFLSTFHALQIK